MAWTDIADGESVASATNKINTLGDDVQLKAPLDSPALTGTPTAPTAAANTNTTQIATTAFVDEVKNQALGNQTILLTGNTIGVNKRYVADVGGSSYTVPTCATNDVIVLFASDDYAVTPITLTGDVGVTIDGGASYSWDVQKTITLRATGTNTWVKSLAPNSGGAVTTAYAWNPLPRFDSTNANYTHISFDTIPTDLLTSNDAWFVDLRIATASNRDDSAQAMMCTNVSSNGFGWYPDGRYFTRMTSSNYLLSCDNDTPANGGGFWIIYQYDGVSSVTAWVDGIKELNNVSVSFSATAPTSMGIGSENFGYTAAYFYGICGMSISSIIFGVGDNLSDAEASEFTSAVNDYTSFTTALQNKIDENITFDASGAVNTKGTQAVTFVDDGIASHEFIEVIIQ